MRGQDLSLPIKRVNTKWKPGSFKVRCLILMRWHFGRTLAVKVRKWNLVMLPKRGAIKPSQPVVRMIASLWTFLLTPRLKALSKFKWSTPKAKVSAKRNSFLSVPAVVEEVVVLLWPLLLNPLPFTGHTVHLSRDVRLSVP